MSNDEIKELKPINDGMSCRYEWKEVINKINELVKAINELRKEKE